MEQKITSSDQKCISECILKHWSESSDVSSEERLAKYEQCLTSCSVCG